MINKIVRLTFISLFLAFSACGPENSSENKDISTQIDAGLVIEDNSYPIACFYFDPSKPDYGQNFMLTEWKSVWASTTKRSHISAQGERRGGFIIADSFAATQTLRSDIPLNINSQDDLENACQDSINRTYPGRNLKLYRIRAYKTIVSSKNYPIVVSEKASTSEISRMVVFGDSLSDTGMLKARVKNFPNEPYFLGRFSNGPVWNEILAKMANLAVKNISQGGAISAPVISVDDKSLAQLVVGTGRWAATGSVQSLVTNYLAKETNNGQIANPERTLFFLWMGANDYLSKVILEKDFNELIDDPNKPNAGYKSIALNTAYNTLKTVRLLYNAGARKFMIGNMPDIGISPFVTLTKGIPYTASGQILTQEEKTYQISERMTRLAIAHNAELNKLMIDLKLEMPDAIFILYDSYKSLEMLKNSTGPYGESNYNYGIDLNKSFTTIYAPEKAPKKVGISCYTQKKYSLLNKDEICTNGNEMLFWDDVHPTSIGHCGIAFYAHKQLYDLGMLSVKANYDDYIKLCKPTY